MIYFVYTVHIFISFFLILVVLLQQGKGADLSVFGGGSTQAAFGARGAATILHKLTVACFVLFIVTTMSIGILQRGQRTSSVMTDVEAGEVEEEAAVPAATETDAAPEAALEAAAEAPAPTDPGPGAEEAAAEASDTPVEAAPESEN